MSDDDRKIGYGNPPKHSQFGKGRSGNPKGRPKGSRNFKTEVRKALKQPVKVTVDGKRKTVSTQHAMLMRLREKALKGEQRAIDRMLELSRNFNDEELAADSGTLGLVDTEIIEAYNQRLLRRHGISPDNAESEADDDTARGSGTEEDPSDPLAPEEEDDDGWLK